MSGLKAGNSNKPEVGGLPEVTKSKYEEVWTELKGMIFDFYGKIEIKFNFFM